MRDYIDIPTCGRINGVVRPPGSKSLTNRALICAALANGESVLEGSLDSEDTRVMIGALRQLGLVVESIDRGTCLRVEGQSGHWPHPNAKLNLANSGTSIRFLTAMVALGHGEVSLDGVERMRKRPILELVTSLNELGARVTCRHADACPPVDVIGRGLAGGSVKMRGDISSQYLSALMMVSPFAASDVTITIVGPQVSRPYVEMTQQVMEQFGVNADLRNDARQVTVASGQRYQGREFDIEPDASAASYFWAAAAISGGEVRVSGLSRKSLQGDVRFCDCLEKMGCDVRYDDDGIVVRGSVLRGIDVDMNEISDTVQTLAAVALFAGSPTRIRGVAHNRHKETDRIGDLATELRRLGAEVDEHEDGLSVMPRQLQGADIETYDDHRMAMSLSLVGLRVPGVRILNPDCTSKTYPAFFEDLGKLTKNSHA